MDYLVIGNSAAGIGAVEGIREYDSEGEITVISDELHHTYSRPLISYYLAGKVDFDKMKYRPDNFYNEKKVNFMPGVTAVNVKTGEKTVELHNGKTLDFDKLIIATGGKPFIPPVKGSDKNNIYTFIKLDDARALAERLKRKDEKAVILGAGLIGLKAAEALVKIGVEVMVVELADQILSTILDKEAARVIQSHLEEQGVKFYLSDTIQEFKGDKTACAVKLRSGLEFKTDLGIIAVGVRPNMDFVSDSGIKINRGILVNNKMETNIEGIYAAGDVSEGYDLLRGTSGVIPIWPNAYNQGLVAGQNMSGADEVYEEGFARNSIGFFGLPMITAGIINPEQEEEYEISKIYNADQNTYKKIVIKDSKLVGFIYLNQVDRAGILTGLIKEQADISSFKNKILNDDFGYLDFEQDVRKEKLYKY